MAEIKGCPVGCNDENSYRSNPTTDGTPARLFRKGAFHVYCRTCGVCGPTEETECGAITAWNELRRPEAKAARNPEWVAVGSESHDNEVAMVVIRREQMTIPSPLIGSRYRDRTMFTVTLKKNVLTESEASKLALTLRGA